MTASHSFFSAPVSQPSTSTAAAAEMVSLRAVLSACADAALRGCEEVRAVQATSRADDGTLASTRKVRARGLGLARVRRAPRPPPTHPHSPARRDSARPR